MAGPVLLEPPRKPTRKAIRRPQRSSRFRLATPKEVLASLAALAVIVIIVIRNHSTLNSGSRLEYPAGELYYTKKVSRQAAEKLGNYLVREGFFTGGDFKSVQIDRPDKTYQFRMVVKKGLDSDPQFLALAKVMAAELSRDVFDSVAVEVHLCDDALNTLRVVVPL